MIIGLALAWLGILVGGWLGWQLLRQNGRMLLRLDDLEKRLDELDFDGDGQPKGLSLGSEAPDFQLADLAGKNRTLAEFRGRRILLIFFNPACGVCREMMPKLAALARPADTPSDPMDHEKGEGPPFPLIITTGDTEANRQIFAEHKVRGPVLLQKNGDVAKAYQANGTPTGYLIDAEEGSPVNWRSVRTRYWPWLRDSALNPQRSTLNPRPAAMAMAVNTASRTVPWRTARSNAMD